MIHFADYDGPDASSDITKVTCPGCLTAAAYEGLISQFDVTEKLIRLSSTMTIPKTRAQFKFDVLEAAIAGAKTIEMPKAGTFRLRGVPANIKALLK